MAGDVKDNIRNKLRQSRVFIFALIVVFAVWLISNMSERKIFREEYVISYDGVDTALYALTCQEKVMIFDINSNGFRTFRRNIHGLPKMHIDISNEMRRHQEDSFSLTLDVNQMLETLTSQIDLISSDNAQPVQEKLHLTIDKRVGKPFIPKIDKVEFQFEGMHGLCGNPVVKPDTVWLYGSQASLDKIQELYAAPQVIKHVFCSGSYKVRLDPVWKKYPDLRSSTEKIEIQLPVETFIEKKVSVPVEFVSDENIHRVNLYPPKVDVTLLVPRNEYANIDEHDIEVIATNNSDSSSTLTPSVRRFPANVRVKTIEPPMVRYTVIK